MSIPNALVVPLVDLTTGRITREWIKPLEDVLTSSTTTDTTALAAAVATLTATIATLTVSVTALQASADERDTPSVPWLTAQFDDMPVIVRDLPVPDEFASIISMLMARVQGLESEIEVLKSGTFM